MVTELRSRLRVARKNEGTRKPEGDERTLVRVPNRGRVWEVNRHPVPTDRSLVTRQSSSRGKSRRQWVKHRKVLERVYNRRRLWLAWQQVRKNAGAAGIDRISF
jgi:hypothetical protein